MLSNSTIFLKRIKMDEKPFTSLMDKKISTWGVSFREKPVQKGLLAYVARRPALMFGPLFASLAFFWITKHEQIHHIKHEMHAKKHHHSEHH